MISAALVLATAGAARAQGTGSDGYFQLKNDTEGNIPVGVCTNDGNGWSQNRIEGVQVMPGENGTAEFPADIGNCDQLFRRLVHDAHPRCPPILSALARPEAIGQARTLRAKG